MKILTIIDSFKGTITSKRLGEITKEVLESRGHSVDIIPVADGGDGFCDAIGEILLTKKINFQNEVKTVFDPLFRKISSYYYISSDTKTAYIELAKASGINLLSRDELNPFITSTFGFGELIKDAIEKGCKEIVLGIGGSATNDAGCGMLEALGVKFYDKNNNSIFHINNEKLSQINSIDYEELKKLISDVKVIVLSDVTNPLLGDKGATYIFSSQKGAKKEDLKLLESNISSVAKYNKEQINTAGAGAAGGVGYALLTYLNAKMYSGIDYILDLIDYDNLIEKYDVIITGEGKIDNQSLGGKVVFRVSSRSKNKKVILVCGINELKNIDCKTYNVSEIYSVVGPDISMEDSLNDPDYYYRKMIEKIKL